MLTEKDYCDYDICVAFEELGFREPTLAHYMENYPNNLIYHYRDDACVKDCYRRVSSRDGVFGAPTLYEAQKWLREEKRLHIEVFFSFMDDKRQLHYDWHIVHNIRFDDDEYTYYCDVLDSMGGNKSYEEALSEGVRASIKILQDEQKENN